MIEALGDEKPVKVNDMCHVSWSEEQREKASLNNLLRAREAFKASNCKERTGTPIKKSIV